MTHGSVEGINFRQSIASGRKSKKKGRGNTLRVVGWFGSRAEGGQI